MNNDNKTEQKPTQLKKLISDKFCEGSLDAS